MASNFGESVYYGKPFFLRRADEYKEGHIEGGYWKCEGVNGNYGKLHSTSLMTFHGPKASRRYESSTSGPFHASSNLSMEEKSSSSLSNPLIPKVEMADRRVVDFFDRVTIYGNVGEDGLYLSPAMPSLSWKKTKKDIMREPIGESEWSLSRLDGKIRGEVCYGDIICLESMLHPGYFISSGTKESNSKSEGKESSNNSEGPLKLSNINKDYYVILCPTLRELVTLEAERKSNSAYKSTVYKSRTKLLDEDCDIVKYQKIQSEYALEKVAELPPEIMYHVFKYIRHWKSTFRLVCKSWRDIAEREVSIIRLNNTFSTEGSKITRFRITSFVERCPNIKKLFLKNMDDINEKESVQLFHKKLLVKIHLGGCRNLTDEKLQYVVQNKPLLQSLNIACSRVTDDGLKFLADQCPNLSSLDLYGCSLVSPNGIAYLLLQLPRLQALNVRGTPVTLDHVVALQSKFKKPKKIQILTGPLLADETDIY